MPSNHDTNIGNQMRSKVTHQLIHPCRPNQVVAYTVLALSMSLPLLAQHAEAQAVAETHLPVFTALDANGKPVASPHTPADDGDEIKREGRLAPLSDRTQSPMGASGDAAKDVFDKWLDTKEPRGAKNAAPAVAIVPTLYRAAGLAVERSPQVGQASADLKAAGYDVDEVKGQRWPQINVGTQSKTTQFGPNSNNGAATASATTFNVTTPVFDWGRISKSIDSRKQSAIAAERKYDTSIESVSYDVCGNIVELVRNRAIAGVSQEYVDRMTALVRMLDEIVKVDAGRASELTQAKARLLQAQTTRDATQARVRDFELNLRKLIGNEPLMIPRGNEWVLSVPALDQLLVDVANHPAIRQAEAEASAADLNADAVRASSRPQVNWDINKTTGTDVNGRPQAWQTGLSMNWQIFRGGSTSASIDAARQRALASRQRKEQVQLDQEFVVRSAHQDAATFLGRSESYAELTVETERVRRIFFEQWYHLGRRSLLDVLTAESDNYANQVNVIGSRFDGYQAIFKQYAGAGKLVQWLRENGTDGAAN